MTNAYTCPHCGARTTPFAAGCAFCGADLDAYRREQQRGPAARLQARLRRSCSWLTTRTVRRGHETRSR